MGFNAASYARFNDRKAAANRALTPAKIVFDTAAPGRVFDVSFGEKQNDGGLHSSGQVIEDQRVGILFIGINAGHYPALSQTFTHVETKRRYRIVAPIVALPNEAVIKCGCVRIES